MGIYRVLPHLLLKIYAEMENRRRGRRAMTETKKVVTDVLLCANVKKTLRPHHAGMERKSHLKNVTTVILQTVTAAAAPARLKNAGLD